jgi:hypothetical protein
VLEYALHDVAGQPTIFFIWATILHPFGPAPDNQPGSVNISLEPFIVRPATARALLLYIPELDKLHVYQLLSAQSIWYSCRLIFQARLIMASRLPLFQAIWDILSLSDFDIRALRVLLRTARKEI